MKHHLIILSLLLFAACKPSEALRISEDFVLQIEQTGCRGTCPAYKIRVEASGLAVWTGLFAVDMMGNWEKKLSRREMKRIALTLAEYDFNGFKNEYGGGTADIPALITTLTHRGAVHRVVDIRNAPTRLKEMEARLLGIIGTEGFERK